MARRGISEKYLPIIYRLMSNTKYSLHIIQKKPS